jgi:transcriptional regulator with XRE-family HTH domain
MDEQTFAKLMKEGHERTGMSLLEVAQIVRTAPGTVSRWENGHSAPYVTVREAIIKRLFPEE